MHLVTPEKLFRNTIHQVQFKVNSFLDGRIRLVVLDRTEFQYSTSFVNHPTVGILGIPRSNVAQKQFVPSFEEFVLTEKFQLESPMKIVFERNESFFKIEVFVGFGLPKFKS